ncbi:MAG TPA: hemolysin III family protein [Chloroflexota bacterium]|nr:hemolysin III family protein [Chloroflexota bacterium]
MGRPDWASFRTAPVSVAHPAGSHVGTLALDANPPAPHRIATEELANALTHGAGALLGLAGMSVLVHTSLRYSVATHTAAVLLYGLSLVSVFTASTLYHATALSRWNALFGVIDRSCIFALIAGTYTPFAVTALSGPGRTALLGSIWLMCAVGTAACGLARFRTRTRSIALYLLAALPAAVVVHLVHPLPSLLGPGGAALVVGGGVCYSIGIAFYVRRAAYAHTMWHLCVLAGSGLHYFGVLLYATPK